MGDKFRNFSVYGKDGRKVEFMTTASLKGASNSEQIIVDGKVAGASEGVKTSSASIAAAICVGGRDSTQVLYDLWDSGEYTDFTFGMIDGRILSANMKVDSFEYGAQAANGTTTFSCELIGAKPKKVG
jgi:hypothetical protein